MFWAGLAQGMVVFAAVLKLAKGHWGGVVIRFAEAGAAFTTVAVVLFIGLVIGRQYIFTWIHEPRPEIGGWLTNKWFFLRNGVVLVALSWLSWRFVRRDVGPMSANWRPARQWNGSRTPRGSCGTRRSSYWPTRSDTACSRST